MTISPNKWELDVQGYLNVCNITSATPRKQIRDFAKGVNDLGLWNSMVCWPLRSSQNYGSGDTVFSLGGLGAFNGTRVGGPTWGADGIVTSIGGGSPYLGAAANYIQTAISLTNYGTRSMFAVGREIVATTQNSTSLIMVSGQERPRYMIYGNQFGGMALSLSRLNESASVGYLSANESDRLKVLGVANFGTSFHSTAAIFGARSLSRYEDGVLAGGDGPRGAWSDSVSDASVLRFGYRTESGAPTSDSQAISFVSDMRVALTAPQIAQLHTIYKDTLGQGLGLP